MDVKELHEVDLFLQEGKRFIKNLEEIREIYIQSAEQKVLLDEEVPIMEEIISSWSSYQNIEQLQTLWKRRSFFHYKNSFFKAYEAKIFFYIYEIAKKP